MDGAICPLGFDVVESCLHFQGFICNLAPLELKLLAQAAQIHGRRSRDILPENKNLFPIEQLNSDLVGFFLNPRFLVCISITSDMVL